MIELRAYVRTRQLLDQAETPEAAERAEGTRLGRLAREIEFELAAERYAERKKGGARDG